MRQAFRTLVGGIESMVGPKLPDLAEVPPPFFGRGRELEALRRAMHAVRKQAECRSVTILAGPGIGKTRLLDEFLREVQSLDDPPVRVFRCAATKDGSRWSCFTQLLGERFDIAGIDGLEAAKAAVRSQVAGVLDDRRVGDVLYLLGDLLELEFPKSPVTRALEDGGPESSVLKRTVLRSFLEADAGHGPMCFVFDDLHLCHEHTLSLLRFLVENVRGPVMFLAAARPELLGRSEAEPPADRHTFLHLEPLGEMDTAALIGSLLSPDGITPMHLVEQAREVTGGNPGRIEETARVFRETGTLPPPPSSEEPALDARIDALAGADRLLLQKAALMGGVFWLGALIVLDRAESDPPVLWNQEIDQSRRELAERLSRLADRDYLLRLPDSTFPGDEEYVFRRRLERDRLQAMTSPADTQRWHRLLADWLDGKPEVRSHEEYLEMLAEQREKSGALELAGIAYFEAAERARASRAVKRELVYCEKALALLGEEQYTRRLDALLRAGELLERFGKLELALDRYRDVLVLAFRLDRRPSWLTARLAATRLLLTLGRSDDSMRHLQGVATPVEHVATPIPAPVERADPQELGPQDIEPPLATDPTIEAEAPETQSSTRHPVQMPPPMRPPIVTLDFALAGPPAPTPDAAHTEPTVADAEDGAETAAAPSHSTAGGPQAAPSHSTDSSRVDGASDDDNAPAEPLIEEAAKLAAEEIPPAGTDEPTAAKPPWHDDDKWDPSPTETAVAPSESDSGPPPAEVPQNGVAEVTASTPETSPAESNS
ncbi:MAG TPA: AAA family ATPase [Polyangiaceae bacterium]